MARLTMSEMKEVLRLRFRNELSYRLIEVSTGFPKSTVLDYCVRFNASKLSLEEALQLPENELEVWLFPERTRPANSKRPMPDFEYIAKEIRKKGITWLLLWQEYKSNYPDGYNYTQFKKYCKDHIQRLSPTMRQIYHAGETMLVDYSGLTMELADPISGEVKPVQIFVAVLGASGAVFVHATSDQKKASFILSHTLAFEYFGGVAEKLIPDNLKSAVTEHRKDYVKINDSYADMARHYGTVVIPARPRHPQDKAKAEQAVQGIQRWIMAKLRNRVFFSIQELNDAIAPLMEIYNHKEMRGIGKSRFELLEEIDRPALLPLPKKRYQYREYVLRTVQIDYHVDIEGSYYSVPYQYIKSKVDVWYSNSLVEIFLKGNRIATHPRSFKKGYASTLDEHMPPNHLYRNETWNPGRILNWASSIGLNTARLMKAIMESKSHPVKGYQTCIAILNLSKKWPKDELELACKKACDIRAYTVKTIESLLKSKLYLEPSDKDTTPLKDHQNIRGKNYYTEEICH